MCEDKFRVHSVARLCFNHFSCNTTKEKSDCIIQLGLQKCMSTKQAISPLHSTVIDYHVKCIAKLWGKCRNNNKKCAMYNMYYDKTIIYILFTLALI